MSFHRYIGFNFFHIYQYETWTHLDSQQSQDKSLPH